MNYTQEEIDLFNSLDHKPLAGGARRKSSGGDAKKRKSSGSRRRSSSSGSKPRVSDSVKKEFHRQHGIKGSPGQEQLKEMFGVPESPVKTVNREIEDIFGSDDEYIVDTSKEQLNRVIEKINKIKKSSDISKEEGNILSVKMTLSKMDYTLFSKNEQEKLLKYKNILKNLEGQLEAAKFIERVNSNPTLSLEAEYYSLLQTEIPRHIKSYLTSTKFLKKIKDLSKQQEVLNFKVNLSEFSKSDKSDTRRRNLVIEFNRLDRKYDLKNTELAKEYNYLVKQEVSSEFLNYNIVSTRYNEIRKAKEINVEQLESLRNMIANYSQNDTQYKNDSLNNQYRLLIADFNSFVSIISSTRNIKVRPISLPSVSSSSKKQIIEAEKITKDHFFDILKTVYPSKVSTAPIENAPVKIARKQVNRQKKPDTQQEPEEAVKKNLPAAYLSFAKDIAEELKMDKEAEKYSEKIKTLEHEKEKESTSHIPKFSDYKMYKPAQKKRMGLFLKKQGIKTDNLGEKNLIDLYFKVREEKYKEAKGTGSSKPLPKKDRANMLHFIKNNDTGNAGDYIDSLNDDEIRERYFALKKLHKLKKEQVLTKFGKKDANYAKGIRNLTLPEIENIVENEKLHKSRKISEEDQQEIKKDFAAAPTAAAVVYGKKKKESKGPSSGVAKRSTTVYLGRSSAGGDFKGKKLTLADLRKIAKQNNIILSGTKKDDIAQTLIKNKLVKVQ